MKQLILAGLIALTAGAASAYTYDHEKVIFAGFDYRADPYDWKGTFVRGCKALGGRLTTTKQLPYPLQGTYESYECHNK